MTKPDKPETPTVEKSPAATKYTQKMRCHINCGSESSELHYDVYANGEKTNIVHYRRTTGRPDYLITDDLYQCAGKTFDALEQGSGHALRYWLDHIVREGGDRDWEA
jgi:hypothetical protein